MSKNILVNSKLDKGEIFIMINMAVLNLKDIIKYIVKITILVTVVIGITKYLSQNQSNIKNQIQETNNKKLMTSFINIALPVTNTESINETSTKLASIDPLKLALGMELKVINSLEETKDEQLTSSESKEDATKVEQAQTGLKTEVQSSNVPNKYTTQYNGVKIKNEVKYKLTEEILKPDITVKKDNILIYHTHSCESYTPSEKYQYKKTGNFRTTDKNYSVIRVGNELEAQLKTYGYNVIHDESYHDYPSYTGSYANSLKTVTKLLDENKNTDVVIDLHRDAIGDSTYAPTVKIGEEYAAQLMFVIGGNEGSIKHETWAQNLKFAIKVQEKANELYPGLFKPIILRGTTYNQHVTKAATIIEVGATGNTLDQTLVSMKYLAKVLSEVVK